MLKYLARSAGLRTLPLGYDDSCNPDQVLMLRAAGALILGAQRVGLRTSPKVTVYP